MIKPAWIAVDWGTSNLRLWAMGAEGEVLDRLCTSDGMVSLNQNQFEAKLLSEIEPWLAADGYGRETPVPVVACGMVGARQGWREAPYIEVPAAPAQSFVEITPQDSRIVVRLLSGMKQSEPPDVMRGEETQIAGFLTGQPDFDGALCLPGTHCKWVNIYGGEVRTFRTVMTGELFALLSQQSVLKHSLGDWQSEAFVAAVEVGFSEPAEILTKLFAIRASDLLGSQPHGQARLSGLLIGAELASTQALWRDQVLAILGDNQVAELYQLALDALGKETSQVESERATLAGLQSAYEAWRK